MTTQELINHYRRMKGIHGALSPSLEEKLVHLELVFGAMPADSTGEAYARAAIERWRHCAPGTIKRYLVQLKAVLRRAERDGLLARAPHIDLPFVHDVVYVDIDANDVTLLLDYVKWTEPKWYPLTLLLVHTGARLGEAMAVVPERDISKHGVRLLKPVARRTKTIERIVPPTSRIEAEVAASLFAKRPIIPAGIAPASVASCLGRVIDASTDALKMKRLRVHDLRHAFAAVLAEAGGDLADIASVLGHTNIAMSQRYRGLVKTRVSALLRSV